MKLTITFSFLVMGLLFSGCATNSGGDAASNDTSSAESPAQPTGAKTAYEGSTGSGLLMERYKSGQIEGFQD